MPLRNILLLIFIVTLVNCQKDNRDTSPKILIFSKTAGFQHDCIAEGGEAIRVLCRNNDIEVDTTTNASFFNEEELSQYSAIIFFNTTEDVLNFNQEVAFERYIQAGGGYVGIHAASDTEYEWAWYGQLVGAYFESHPKIQEAKFVVQDSLFLATRFLPKEWVRTDELYNLKIVNPDVNVALTIDESTYEGGTNGAYHPMAWYHEYDGGRAFYTALGHTKASYKEELFLQHILAGIQYAIGDNKKLDYTKAKTPIPPSNDRFTKNILSKGKFYEPTEMTILPNNNVLIAQRRGELMMYDAELKEISQVGFLDVYHKTSLPDVNAEEGFMGLKRDPDFDKNNWIYTFYSPRGEESVNRLSRFKFSNNLLQMETEQIILDVKSQREICCHTGGSIAFGPEGLLYLSTGDNTTPFDEPDAKYVNHGYAPLNDLPGKEQYDARRSSANTNDLRGKILRIRVNEDGSYEIPQGNLFPQGMEKTRPEIYTMGHRNPYRISVDPKNGYVYWGDVGPDAANDDIENRGPRGYDEMNQARGPGNFGWPLFIADNLPYKSYDYSNGESGEFFDSKNPINNSNNNTGLKILPPAQPAYVFYHYDKSKKFSGLSSGGRNAMAGPVFYADLFPKDQSLPQEYDGKIIIYDWIRGWMKVVSLNENGTFNKLEPFAPNTELNNLIDMEFGPDGKLYLLEYGSGWFSQNEDSTLSILEYNSGNLPPKIIAFSADQTEGKLPLEVNFAVDASDFEDGALTFIWTFDNNHQKTTKEPKATFSYIESGINMATVEVIDEKGLSTTSETLSIISGNTRPNVTIEIEGVDPTHFEPGKPLKYKVVVDDEEDELKGIDITRLFVSVDYMNGFDQASVSVGHQVVSEVALGEALSLGLSCRACHKTNEKSVGPSYVEVAARYNSKGNAVQYLKDKIKNGGTGVWGENVMPVNPEITDSELDKIVKYVLSLSGDKNIHKSLPNQGIITPELNKKGKVLVVTASYTDRGEEAGTSLTGISKVILNCKE